MNQLILQSGQQAPSKLMVENTSIHETKLSTLGLTREDFIGLSWIFCEDEDC
jgi:hypothetical protein